MEKPYEIKIVESEDGSHTLFHTGLNETYHSMHGAVQESEHVFIQAGLDQKITTAENAIHIFEVGFGTGLNAWLTYKRIAGTGLKVVYHSIEPYPLEEKIYSKLNYVQTTQDKNLGDFFSALHRAPWDEAVQLNDSFTLKKIKARLEEYQISSGNFDVIYYDAFAPSKQAEI